MKISSNVHILQWYIKFKTEELYFPILLTKLNGDRFIRIRVYFAKPVVSIGSNELMGFGWWRYFYLEGKHKKIEPEYADFYGVRNTMVTVCIHFTNGMEMLIDYPEIYGLRKVCLKM